VYPILDTARGLEPRMVAAAWLAAGARVLQFRHKTFWSRDVYEQAGAVASLCREAGALFFVNDRADVAALLAAGLHVGQEDLAPLDARRVIGDAAALGLSTHNETQLRAAGGEPVSYIALGPVFGTMSKANPDPPVGIEGIDAWRALVEKPLVAIGGVTRQTARAAWQAGADSIAVIGDLYPPDPTPARLRQRMEEWQRLAKT
jgi:thiamine-phosphate pyrophosphorylase